MPDGQGNRTSKFLGELGCVGDDLEATIRHLSRPQEAPPDRQLVVHQVHHAFEFGRSWRCCCRSRHWSWGEGPKKSVDETGRVEVGSVPSTPVTFTASNSPSDS